MPELDVRRRSPHKLKDKSIEPARTTSVEPPKTPEHESSLKIPILKASKPIIRDVEVKRPETTPPLKLGKQSVDAPCLTHFEPKKLICWRGQGKPGVKQIESVELKPIGLPLGITQIIKRGLAVSVGLETRHFKLPAQPFHAALKEREHAGPSSAKKEFKDIVELIFGESFYEKIRLWRKPVCIIVPQDGESYEDMIASVCREVYFERRGRKPIPVDRETFEQLRDEYEPSVEGEIVVVRSVDEHQRLWQVLREFYSRDIGYLILVSSDPSRLKTNIIKSAPEAVESVVELERDRLHNLRKARGPLLRIIRGYREEGVELEAFGKEFKKAIDSFEEYLIESYLHPIYSDLPDWVRENFEKLRKGDELTDALRLFVSLNIVRSRPTKIDEKGNIFIDGRVFKPKSLQGIPDAIAHIKSEAKESGATQTSFILKNISILLHLKEFLELVRVHRGLGIYGVDLEGKRLVPVQEIGEDIARIFQSL